MDGNASSWAGTLLQRVLSGRDAFPKHPANEVRMESRNDRPFATHSLGPFGKRSLPVARTFRKKVPARRPDLSEKGPCPTGAYVSGRDAFPKRPANEVRMARSDLFHAPSRGQQTFYRQRRWSGMPAHIQIPETGLQGAAPRCFIMRLRPREDCHRAARRRPSLLRGLGVNLSESCQARWFRS
jgi:hypothetical protein